jgi:hypothetical protein
LNDFKAAGSLEATWKILSTTTDCLSATREADAESGERSPESYEGVKLDIKFLSAILWVGSPK